MTTGTTTTPMADGDDDEEGDYNFATDYAQRGAFGDVDIDAGDEDDGVDADGDIDIDDIDVDDE